MPGYFIEYLWTSSGPSYLLIVFTLCAHDTDPPLFVYFLIHNSAVYCSAPCTLSVSGQAMLPKELRGNVKFTVTTLISQAVPS